MRKPLIVACLGTLLTAGLATQACAGGYANDPQVIPGIGPGDATPYGVAPGTPVYDPYTGSMRPAAVAAPPRPMVRLQPVSSPHRYGGGLLEALIGGDPDRGAPPVPAPQAYAMYPGAGAPTNSAAAQVDPYGNTVVATRPGRVLDPMFQRQRVAYEGPQSPGTIVIDTTRKFLYLVESGGEALRYGIGVGRPGFVWAGTKTITRKAEWPDWTPPSEMRLRRPDLPFHMEGGIANPLGARAMYLGSTLYRIHGTNEPETIGTNVSSGCIRLTNEDVSDLYGRVRVGTRVVVM